MHQQPGYGDSLERYHMCGCCNVVGLKIEDILMSAVPARSRAPSSMAMAGAIPGSIGQGTGERSKENDVYLTSSSKLARSVHAEQRVRRYCPPLRHLVTEERHQGVRGRQYPPKWPFRTECRLAQQRRRLRLHQD